MRATATIHAKQDCILSGLGSVNRILEIYSALDKTAVGHHDVISHPEIFDGVRLHDRQAIAVIRHNARVILSSERVILNLLQRMSGIATTTRRYADAIAGTKTRILHTRQTVPGPQLPDR